LFKGRDRRKNVDSLENIQTKLEVAVQCLCGAGTFEERLWNAYVSALDQVSQRDANVELVEDLGWLLARCQRYLIAAGGPTSEGRMSLVPELERLEFTEKLVGLLTRCSEIVGQENSDEEE
jgi:hypothetical protein